MALFKCKGAQRLDENGEAVCNYESEKAWTGACPGCGSFYDIIKYGVDKKNVRKFITAGDSVELEEVKHISTGISVLDHVLSGGIVAGSTVAFAGIHGGGKSSLWLEACDAISDKLDKPCVFVTSEQSSIKILQICQRLQIANKKLKIVSTRSVHEVLQINNEIDPILTVYDSLQKFKLFEHDATPKESEEIAALVTEDTTRRKRSSVIISQLSKDLGMKGGTSVLHGTETEIYLYKFDDSQDRKAVHALLDRKTRVAIRSGEIEGEKLRVLICGKNRDGEEGRKAFFLMTAEGFIQPLKLHVKDDDEADEEEVEVVDDRQAKISHYFQE